MPSPLRQVGTRSASSGRGARSLYSVNPAPYQYTCHLPLLYISPARVSSSTPYLAGLAWTKSTTPVPILLAAPLPPRSTQSPTPPALPSPNVPAFRPGSRIYLGPGPQPVPQNARAPVYPRTKQLEINPPPPPTPPLISFPSQSSVSHPQPRPHHTPKVRGPERQQGAHNSATQTTPAQTPRTTPPE